MENLYLVAGAFVLAAFLLTLVGTFSERGRFTLVWFRDQFAGWFMSFWLYIILWTVVAGAFVVLLYIDGKFSRNLAHGADIAPLSFQAMGWVYRLFAVSFLMAAARCKFKGIKGGITFRWLGAFASVIVCMHAFGFGFEALDDRRDQALAARESIEIVETGNDDLIIDAQASLAKKEAQRDKTLAQYDAEINQYITDGLNNDDLADDTRVLREQARAEYKVEIAALETKIEGLKTEGTTVKAENADDKADAEAWAPLFVGMAQLFTWTKTPTDWPIYICAVVFVIFWVLLGESLVIFLPERIYVMHLHDAANSTKPKYDASIPDGMVDLRMPVEEWEAHKAAMAAAEGAAPKDPADLLRIGQEGYWIERIGKALKTRMRNPTAEGMFNTYFSGIGSVHELRAHLSLMLKRGALSQDHFDFITREGKYAPPEQMTNGEDHSEGANDDDDVDDTSTDQLPAIG